MKRNKAKPPLPSAMFGKDDDAPAHVSMEYVGTYVCKL